MNLRSNRIVALVVLCTFTSLVSAFGALQVTDLRCEYEAEPLGLDSSNPGLSWRIESDVEGEMQTAYQILVAGSLQQLDKNVGDLWDSGKVDSDQSQHIAYAGRKLSAKSFCFWKVRVWDKTGEPGSWSAISRWSMGLLEPGDWSGKWISPPEWKTPRTKLEIKKAVYRTEDGKESDDVTVRLSKLLDGSKPVVVNNENHGGEATNKQLVVDYSFDGEAGRLVYKQNERVLLSDFDRRNKPSPLFRKKFDLEAAPSSALVTVHSPAYYELYINGSKVGDDVLTPAVSRAGVRSFYVTYDVAEYLEPGGNCIGLWMGNGWSDRIVVRAQIDAIVNGKPFAIGTDASWKSSKSGRYKIGNWKWGDFGGELIDARELLPGWSLPGYNDRSWKSAIISKALDGEVNRQICPPNRVGDPIPAKKITSLDNGLYEVDFGTALTGWLRYEIPQLPSGTQVTMTFADEKKTEKTSKYSQLAPGACYQTFAQISKFIAGGKAGEVFEHKFNYASFRYVIIDGLPVAPVKEDLAAMLVDSDLEMVGSFECSNDLLNRIHRVNQWTQRCLNLGGYYVDCSHRERRGYGDGQVATEGFMTSFRADRFYRKWMGDWRDAQADDGKLPNTAPSGVGGGGPGWGGLLSAITWRHYLYYGDERILQENYDAIRRYVDYLEKVSQDNDGILTGKVAKYSFIGDWVAPGRGMDTKNAPSHAAREIFNNCYRINQINLLIRMANVLKKEDDAAHYRNLLKTIRPKVHEAFYDAEKQQYVIDEQAYYVMPLMTGIVPEENRSLMLKKLEQNILVKNKGHLDSGMLGTYFMMEYLREIGRSDLVFTMFNQTTYPGWGYMLEQGATTMWEQWNGYWSQVHSCFTSPDNWLYQGLAGIQADPAAPGFKNVIIKPEIVGDVTWVNAHHDSPYGRIVSNWKKENGKLTMEVTVPPNSTATVHVPTSNPSGVMVNGCALAQANHVTFLRKGNERTVLLVGPGSYTITLRSLATNR